MYTAELLRVTDLSGDDLENWQVFRAVNRALRSPYFSCSWVKAVADVRSDVRVMVLRDKQAKAHGFLPLQLAPASIALPVGGALSDYHGLIAAKSLDVNLGKCLRSCGIKRFDFTHVPSSQLAFAENVQLSHPSRVIDIAGGLQSYLQARKDRGSSETKRARKRKRKLEREQGDLRLSCWSKDEGAFLQLLQWKREQYQQSGSPDVFATSWTRDLVQQLLRTGGKGRFGGSMFLLHAGQQLVAANFCLAEGSVLHAWFIAHHPAMARYSPGMVLFESMIEQLADTNLREIDLGAGDYRFKRSLANKERELGVGCVGSLNAATLFRQTEYKLRKIAEAMPIGLLAEFPGKAMRRIDTYRGLA